MVVISVTATSDWFNRLTIIIISFIANLLRRPSFLFYLVLSSFLLEVIQYHDTERQCVKNVQELVLRKIIVSREIQRSNEFILQKLLSLKS